MSSQAELHVLWKIVEALKELNGLVKEANQTLAEFAKGVKSPAADETWREDRQNGDK